MWFVQTQVSPSQTVENSSPIAGFEKAKESLLSGKALCH